MSEYRLEDDTGGYLLEDGSGVLILEGVEVVPVSAGGGRAGRSVLAGYGRDLGWLRTRAGKGDPRFERLVRQAVREAIGEASPTQEETSTEVHTDPTPARVQAVAYRLFAATVLAPLSDMDEARRIVATELAAYPDDRLHRYLVAAPIPFQDDEDEIAVLLMAVI